jgi:integrase
MGLPNQERKLIADRTDVLPALMPSVAPMKKAATLSNLWGLWIESRGPLAPNTINLYRYIAKRFLHYFREKEVTPENMLAWCKYLRSLKNVKGLPLSEARIKEINAPIRGFLRFIKKLGFIKHDLWEFVELPKLPDPKMPELFTEEEYQKIKDFLTPIEKWQWLLWLCILGYRTGMTLIDCCHLRWEQVFLNDEGESYMDVPRAKMRRWGEKAVCRIPIVPGTDLHEWLLKLKKVENYKRFDGLNYVHQDCPGIYSNTMFEIHGEFRAAFNRVGIRTKSFATFRRTFLSNLVNSGMHYALICKISGHTNMKTLLRYLRPDRKALQDGVMKAQQYAESKL